jgi:hypothetical protein
MQGAIEEKIQERAFKKLFLDAVVIQQGRLVEKMKGASRDELLDMIRFGAEEVVRLSDENLGDFDVDELLRSAEQKTEQDKAKIKAMTEKSFSANFSMDGGVPSSTDTFTFDGKDYKDTKKSDGYFLDFGARERKLKSSLNVDASFREQMMQAQVVPKKSMGPRVPKYLQMPQYFEYQFFNVKRLMEINEKKKRAWQTAIDQVCFIFFCSFSSRNFVRSLTHYRALSKISTMSTAWNLLRLLKSVLSNPKVSTGLAETLWASEALVNVMGVTTTRPSQRILRSRSMKSSATRRFSGLALRRCPITNA